MTLRPDRSIRIRKARSVDADAIHRNSLILAQQDDYVEDHQISPETIAAELASANRKFSCLVAEADGPDGPFVIGHAIYFDFPYAVELNPVVILEELVVAPEYRGCGAGRSLMDALVREAAERDVSSIQWVVHKENHRAKAFYERLGATEEPKWVIYGLDADSIRKLAGE